VKLRLQREIREASRAVVVQNLQQAAIDAAESAVRNAALVVGVDDVDVAIQVVVDERSGPADGAIARRYVEQIANTGAGADVAERSGSNIHVQIVGVAVGKELGEDRLTPRPVESIGDEDVEQTIAVDVAHAAGGVSLGRACRRARRRGHVRERAVAVVAEQAVSFHASEHVQIVVPVVVDVAIANAGAVLCGRPDAGCFADVHERRLAGLPKTVLIEAVGAPRPIRDVDVDVSVAIVVEQGHARLSALVHR
jgi:hypothetical protein